MDKMESAKLLYFKDVASRFSRLNDKELFFINGYIEGRQSAQEEKKSKSLDRELQPTGGSK